jgi:hypothetical protein
LARHDQNNGVASISVGFEVFSAFDTEYLQQLRKALPEYSIDKEQFPKLLETVQTYLDPESSLNRAPIDGRGSSLMFDIKAHKILRKIY